MTSKARSQNGFLEPESSPEPNRDANGLRYKKANVYDAVAGKISAAGYIPRHLMYSSTRDTPSSSATAVPPEAVLFKRKDAPTRYAESDIYFSNERRLRTYLPESDLLKALHSYTSDFYSRALAEGGTGDWKSLDETALLAFGILMEEVSRESLGRTGDLVFTESEQIENSQSTISNKRRSASTGRPSKKPRVET